MLLKYIKSTHVFQLYVCVTIIKVKNIFIYIAYKFQRVVDYPNRASY